MQAHLILVVITKSKIFILDIEAKDQYEKLVKKRRINYHIPLWKYKDNDFTKENILSTGK